MKSITSILAAFAVTTTLTFAEDKPAPAKPEAGATAATAAAAPDAKKPKVDPEVAFKKIDGNNDGDVTLEEFNSKGPGKKDAAKGEEMFKKKDKDSNGKLTLEEFKGGGKKKNK